MAPTVQTVKSGTVWPTEALVEPARSKAKGLFHACRRMWKGFSLQFWTFFNHTKKTELVSVAYALKKEILSAQRIL